MDDTLMQCAEQLRPMLHNMDIPPSRAALTAPSVSRNRDSIRAVLQARMPSSGLVLEIAAGTGEHAAYNAAAFPDLRWQPTDVDPQALASIGAWRERAALPNLLPPLRLDASAPHSWPIDQADVVVAINMIHISRWAATEGLITGAGRVLPSDGLLFLYGPYLETGVVTASSNLAFDEDLRRRDARWGLRHLDEITRLAAMHGLNRRERIAMPANNLALLFRKT